MDGYRQEFTCNGISSSTPAHLKILTPEEATTYRRWRRAVLAFYCSVLLLGGVALVVSIPAQHREMAQALR